MSKYNRLPTLCRDRHLEGSKTATLYIDLQINIDCRSPYPFQLSITPSLPPSSCIYRASRATFTIKLFMQFLTLQSSHLFYFSSRVSLRTRTRYKGFSTRGTSRRKPLYRDRRKRPSSLSRGFI